METKNPKINNTKTLIHENPTTNKKLMKIVFMGTPEFAVASLRQIISTDIEVVGVITSPDKLAGRGRKVKFSDVKNFAVQNNLNLLQPTNLKDESFILELKKLNADLFVVVAFRMLPKVVWDMPKYGTINLHGSLLPQYRGAAPINWAIINGEKQTGVTTFFINEKIDTGKIIDKQIVDIMPTDTAGTLHDKLMNTGSELLTKTILKIQSGHYSEIEQDTLINDKIKDAPKIFKEICKINWQKQLIEIYNFIRGLSPYPAAWTELIDEENKKYSLKIFETKIEVEKHGLNYGTILTDNKNYIKVSVKEGFLYLLEIQLQGKKRLKIKEFLNGFDATKIKIINH